MNLEIQLTASYGICVSTDGKSQPDPKFGAERRSSDFWRDFTVSFHDGNDLRTPSYVSGHPNFYCSESGSCVLGGATVAFCFPADSLKSDSLAVQVIPPEGDSVAVDFDLDSLR